MTWIKIDRIKGDKGDKGDPGAIAPLWTPVPMTEGIVGSGAVFSAANVAPSKVALRGGLSINIDYVKNMVIATLPAAFRPKEWVYTSAPIYDDSGKVAFLIIKNNGEIILTSPVPKGYKIYTESIEFYTN